MNKVKKFYNDHKKELITGAAIGTVLGFLYLKIDGQRIKSGDIVVRDDGRTALLIHKRRAKSVVLFDHGPVNEALVNALTNRKEA